MDADIHITLIITVNHSTMDVIIHVTLDNQMLTLLIVNICL